MQSTISAGLGPPENAMPSRSILASRVRQARYNCGSTGIGLAVLQPIAQPDHAALQHLAAHQRHRADRRRNAGILIAGIENARRAFRSIDGGTDCKTDLVNQAGPQEGPVRATAAFEQQAFEPQLAVEYL